MTWPGKAGLIRVKEALVLSLTGTVKLSFWAWAALRAGWLLAAGWLQAVQQVNVYGIVMVQRLIFRTDLLLPDAAGNLLRCAVGDFLWEGLPGVPGL